MKLELKSAFNNLILKHRKSDGFEISATSPVRSLLKKSGITHEDLRPTVKECLEDVSQIFQVSSEQLPFSKLKVVELFEGYPSNTQGTYSFPDQQIEIHLSAITNDPKFKQARKTISHELGHSASYIFLTDEEIKKRVKLQNGIQNIFLSELSAFAGETLPDINSLNSISSRSQFDHLAKLRYTTEIIQQPKSKFNITRFYDKNNLHFAKWLINSYGPSAISRLPIHARLNEAFISELSETMKSVHDKFTDETIGINNLPRVKWAANQMIQLHLKALPLKPLTTQEIEDSANYIPAWRAEIFEDDYIPTQFMGYRIGKEGHPVYIAVDSGIQKVFASPARPDVNSSSPLFKTFNGLPEVFGNDGFFPY